MSNNDTDTVLVKVADLFGMALLVALRVWVVAVPRRQLPTNAVPVAGSETAEPPVTVVDRNVDKRGTREVATAYLQFLYTPQGQELAAENYYRPVDPKVAAKYEKTFTKLNLFKIDELFGGWAQTQKTHFADGGIFDKIYTKR
jgi:ABC-type sulfate transport system substrate-binding protein